VSPIERQMREEHSISLMQEAENRRRRIQEGHQNKEERIQLQDRIERHKTIPRMTGAGNNEGPPIPAGKVEAPGPRGAPYPYPLEAPPEGYDIHASYEPKGGFRFAEYTDGSAPYQITDEIKEKSDQVARVRREYVKQMMKTAWQGYVDHAWGMDEIKPVSGTGDNNWGGMGVTLVDSLDTLWLLGMKDEFWKARDWVRDSLNNAVNRPVSTFETTIRSLGGLVSAYDWSGDQAFLDKAIDLGRRLAKSFDGSNTGLPYGQVNLETGRAGNIGWAGGNVILSEIGSLQIEFRMLDMCAKTPETAAMRKKTEDVFEIMNKISPPNGLFPYYLSNNEASGIPRLRNDHLTFGAMADSFYEYMLKVWIQGGKVEPLYRDMYDKAIQGMHDELLQTSKPSGLVYIADKIGTSRYDHKMDHLVCKYFYGIFLCMSFLKIMRSSLFLRNLFWTGFMGGLLALGAYTDPLGLDSARAQRDLKTGRVSSIFWFSLA
jgi:Glycosyl hydrolase family 47